MIVVTDRNIRNKIMKQNLLFFFSADHEPNQITKNNFFFLRLAR